VGRRIRAYLCFLLPKPAAGVQYIRDIAPRAHCMERQPSNQSMKPPTPDRMIACVLATAPCRGLSLSRWDPLVVQLALGHKRQNLFNLLACDCLAFPLRQPSF
jgi:hypothetical protein